MRVTIWTLRRWTAVSLAVVLLGQVAVSAQAESRFWAERRRAVRRMSPAQTLLASVPSPAWGDLVRAAPLGTGLDGRGPAFRGVKGADLPDWLAAVPLDYGDVLAVHSGRGLGPAVVLIQDAHAVPAAQKNIARILAGLEEKNRALGRDFLVGVEGTFGGFNLAPFRPGAEAGDRFAVADYLVGHSRINGAEYFGMTSEREPILWGVETPSLYAENLRAYLDSRGAHGVYKDALDRLTAALREAEERFFDAAERNFNCAVEGYHDGTLPLPKFLKVLARDVPLGHYPQAARLQRAMEAEDSLNFRAVNEERTAFLQSLSGRLTPADTQGLLEMSLDYRLGRLSHTDYYTALGDVSSRHGLFIRQFTQLKRYVDYLTLSDGLDPHALFDEMEGLKTAAARGLFTTPTPSALWECLEDTRLLHRLGDHAFGPDEWGRYETRREPISHLPQRLASLGVAVEGVSGLTPALLAPYERFYRTALARNDALAANLLNRAEETGARTVALVAGGFHTPGLEARFKERGLAYAVMTPKIGNMSGKESYLEVFTRKRTPLEKMLLGEKLLMNPPSAMAATAQPGSSSGAFVKRLTVVAFLALLLSRGGSVGGMLGDFTHRGTPVVAERVVEGKKAELVFPASEGAPPSAGTVTIGEGPEKVGDVEFAVHPTKQNSFSWKKVISPEWSSRLVGLLAALAPVVSLAGDWAMKAGSLVFSPAPGEGLGHMAGAVRSAMKSTLGDGGYASSGWAGPLYWKGVNKLAEMLNLSPRAGLRLDREYSLRVGEGGVPEAVAEKLTGGETTEVIRADPGEVPTDMMDSPVWGPIPRASNPEGFADSSHTNVAPEISSPEGTTEWDLSFVSDAFSFLAPFLPWVGLVLAGGLALWALLKWGPRISWAKWGRRAVWVGIGLVGAEVVWVYGPVLWSVAAHLVSSLAVNLRDLAGVAGFLALGRAAMRGDVVIPPPPVPLDEIMQEVDKTKREALVAQRKAWDREQFVPWLIGKVNAALPELIMGLLAWLALGHGFAAPPMEGLDSLWLVLSEGLGGGLALRLSLYLAVLLHGAGHAVVVAMVSDPTFSDLMKEYVAKLPNSSLLPFRYIFFPGLSPSDDAPFMRVNLMGWRARLAAIVAPVVNVGVAFVLILPGFPMSGSLLGLGLGVLAAGQLTAGLSSWRDVKDFVSGRTDALYCGNILVLGKAKSSFTRESHRRRSLRMQEQTGVRGSQAAGTAVLTAGHGLVLGKGVNRRRHKITNTLRANFDRAWRAARIQGAKPTEGFYQEQTHFRFATGGASAKNATQPMRWKAPHKGRVWEISTGGRKKSLAQTEMVVDHLFSFNGDIDGWDNNRTEQSLEVSLLGKSWNGVEFQKILTKAIGVKPDMSGRRGVIGTDTIIGAGLQQLLLCQGRWGDAFRMALAVYVAKSAEDLDLLTPSVVADFEAMADAAFEKWFREYEVSVAKYRTLADLYTDISAAKPQAIEALGESLRRGMLAIKGLRKKFSDEEKAVLVERLIGGFFNNDLEESARLFTEHARGTFAPVLQSSLYPGEVALISYKQPLFIGVHADEDPELDYLTVGSEAAAVRVSGEPDENGAPRPPEHMYIMRDGEMAHLRLGMGTARSQISFRDGYSKEEKTIHTLTPEALSAWAEEGESEEGRGWVSLSDNPYFQDQLPDPAVDDKVGDGLKEVPRLLDSIAKDWNNPLSLNRRTADELSALLVEKFRGADKELDQRGEIKKSKQVDVLILAAGESLAVSKAFANDMKFLFRDNLNIEVMDSKRFASNPELVTVGPNTVVLGVSHSGQYFNTVDDVKFLQAVHDLGRCGPVFVMTGLLATPMGQAVGQSFKANAEFGNRIFTDGAGWRLEEPHGLTTVAAHFTFSQLLLHLGRTVRESLPREDRFMVISPKNFAFIQERVEGSIDRAEIIVGRDRRGYSLGTPEHEATVREGNWLSWFLVEALVAGIVTVLHLAGVFALNSNPVAWAVSALPAWVINAAPPLLWKGMLVYWQTAYFYVLGTVLIMWALRILMRRPGMDSFSGRSLFIADRGWAASLVESFVDRLWSLSYGFSKFRTPRGGDPLDGFVDKVAPVAGRGDVMVKGVQENPAIQGTTTRTSTQLQGAASFDRTPLSVGVGHGKGGSAKFNRYLALGGLAEWRGAPPGPDAREIDDSRTGALYRLLGFYVLFHVMARRSQKIVNFILPVVNFFGAPVFFLVYVVSLGRIRIWFLPWDISETQSRAAIFTTPVAPPIPLRPGDYHPVAFSNKERARLVGETETRLPVVSRARTGEGRKVVPISGRRDSRLVQMQQSVLVDVDLPPQIDPGEDRVLDPVPGSRFFQVINGIPFFGVFFARMVLVLVDRGSSTGIKLTKRFAHAALLAVVLFIPGSGRLLAAESAPHQAGFIPSAGLAGQALSHILPMVGPNFDFARELRVSGPVWREGVATGRKGTGAYDPVRAALVYAYIASHVAMSEADRVWLARTFLGTETPPPAGEGGSSSALGAVVEYASSGNVEWIKNPASLLRENELSLINMMSARTDPAFAANAVAVAGGAGANRPVLVLVERERDTSAALDRIETWAREREVELPPDWRRHVEVHVASSEGVMETGGHVVRLAALMDRSPAWKSGVRSLAIVTPAGDPVGWDARGLPPGVAVAILLGVLEGLILRAPVEESTTDFLNSRAAAAQSA
jgi:hypothetical protein